MEEIINDDGIPSYNVVLLGESGVGKTQIINRKAHNTYEEDFQSTTGVSFTSWSVKINQDKSDQNIKLKVWDTAGQEKFRNLISSYFKIGDVFVLVYDITNKESFENIQTWIQLAEDNATKNPVYFLVGNKTDMENEGKRNVRTDEAQNFANGNKMTFFEVSAQTGNDIDKLFEAIANACAGKAIKDVVDSVNNKINNKNSTLKDSKEPEKNDIKISTSSKNNHCNCCPCCNKDEEDKKEGTKSPESTLEGLMNNTL
jgi:small GTP-binding protein